MTEQTNENIEVQKSANEQLADVVKTAVEAKADAAEVAELKSALEALEIPSVEGFAKSEEMVSQITELKSALEAEKAEREALDAVVKSAPAVAVVKENTPMSYNTILKSTDDNLMLKGNYDIITKAELTPNNSADAPVGNMPIYADLVEANPFRGVANVFAVNSASYKIPRLSGVGANKNQNAGAQTEAGGVADVTVNVNDYNSLTEINMNLIDDLPGLDGMVISEQIAQIGKEEHSDIVAVLDAATVTEVNVDLSDDALKDVSTYHNLIASLPNQYWNRSSWVMSPEAYAKLLDANHSGTGSPLVIDPTMGGFTLFSRPIIVSGEMDSGATAGDNPVYFGDFSRGLWIGSRMDMQFQRYTENKIGAFSYYTHMRSGQSVVEAGALRRLVTVA